jgi:hypothetical protein
MTAQTTPAPAPQYPQNAQPAVTAPPWLAARPVYRWRIAAFLLAGAAQLITISALVSMDHPVVNWASLLLAIAPVLLAAVVAFGPESAARPLAVVTVAVMIVGMAGAFAHVGLFFLPAVIVMAITGYLLWRR